MKYLRPACMGDVDVIAKDMREADVREVAAFGRTPETALRLAVTISDIAYTMLDPTGKPSGMLGVTKDRTPGFGLVWLLGTERIPENPILFLRHSKEVLSELFSKYEVLYNYVHKENTLHHKWLKWLNFSFIREVIINGQHFYEFARLRDT